MHEIKLVVIGPGLMGKRHIDLIENNPECLLVGLVAPDHAEHHKLALELNVPLHHNIDSMIESKSIDGVIISSPNLFHVEQAIKCIDAGIPVLIEKPISHSCETAARLVELIEKKNATVLIGHHRAHSPILKTAREIIQNGRLGNIAGIMGSALFYKPHSYFDAGPWRRKIGGGPILINLIHEVSNFRSLCGEIVAVQAISSSKIRNFAVEDTVAISFQFESGALGTFLLSDTAASANSWEQTSQENKSYPTYSDENCYFVAGTQGSLSIPTMQLRYYNNNEKKSWWKPLKLDIFNITRQDPLECQLTHFINVIKGLELPLVSAKDGFNNLKIVEAISKSAKFKKLVHIEL
jgi:predicted dehydrogenase